jgi:hypothetical protein
MKSSVELHPKMVLSPKINKKQWLFTFINLFLIGLFVIIHVQLRQYAFDDAYIHFRVARNYVEIGVPYYNTSETLKVSTSSGWIIFLATLYWAAKIINLESNFSLLISIINALISICGLIVYTKVVELFLERRLSILQKLFLQTIIWAILLPSSVGLMETPLALLTTGLGIYFLLLSKPIGFTLFGISIYLRLELFVLVTIICIIVVFQNKFKLYQILGYLILGLASFIVFDLYYFQTIVPHSIIAKSTVYSSSSLVTFATILYNSLPGLPLVRNQNLLVMVFITVVIILIWTVFRESAIVKKNLYPAALYFSGLLVISIYTFSHAPLFDWYIPLYMLPISIAYFSYSYLVEHPKNIIIKLPLFLLFFLSMISIFSTIYSGFYKPNTFALFEGGSRVKTYLVVGKIINEDYRSATLLTSEIGGLGYSFKGKIFDAAGLASSDVLSFHPMRVPQQRSNGLIGAIPPDYVKFVHPDIIVSYDIFAEALLKDDISTQYNIITLPAYLPEDAIYSESKTIWGSKYLRVYIHKSLPVSDKICALSISTNETPNKACMEGRDSSLFSSIFLALSFFCSQAESKGQK